MREETFNIQTFNPRDLLGKLECMGLGKAAAFQVVNRVNVGNLTNSCYFTATCLLINWYFNNLLAIITIWLHLLHFQVQTNVSKMCGDISEWIYSFPNRITSKQYRNNCWLPCEYVLWSHSLNSTINHHAKRKCNLWANPLIGMMSLVQSCSLRLRCRSWRSITTVCASWQARKWWNSKCCRFQPCSPSSFLPEQRGNLVRQLKLVNKLSWRLNVSQ